MRPNKNAHKVVCFCRSEKRHKPRARNGQYFFFFLQESCGDRMGHTQPGVGCYSRTMRHTAPGTLPLWQASHCSAPESTFGQHTFNKIQTLWKKRSGEKEEQPQIWKKKIWEETGLVQAEKNTVEGQDMAVADTRGCRHLFRTSPATADSATGETRFRCLQTFPQRRRMLGTAWLEEGQQQWVVLIRGVYLIDNCWWIPWATAPLGFADWAV